MKQALANQLSELKSNQASNKCEHQLSYLGNFIPLTAKVLRFSAAGILANQVTRFSIFYFLVQHMPLIPTVSVFAERHVTLLTTVNYIRPALILPMDILNS
jgi:hypothetical protein